MKSAVFSWRILLLFALGGGVLGALNGLMREGRTVGSVYLRLPGDDLAFPNNDHISQTLDQGLGLKFAQIRSLGKFKEYALYFSLPEPTSDKVTLEQISDTLNASVAPFFDKTLEERNKLLRLQEEGIKSLKLKSTQVVDPAVKILFNREILELEKMKLAAQPSNFKFEFLSELNWRYESTSYYVQRFFLVGFFLGLFCFFTFTTYRYWRPNS